jgi:hypothetical protein
MNSRLNPWGETIRPDVVAVNAGEVLVLLAGMPAEAVGRTNSRLA